MPKAKTGGGGPTASGGFNFQAAATAIALSHALRGIPLNWLEGLAADTPISVAAETGGGGDDLRLVLKAGLIVEAQVKKGLTAGAHLWTALMDLAAALAEGKAQFGLLLVSTTTSGTIRQGLAADLVRMGEGALPKAGSLGAKFFDRLKARGLDRQEICARLRIVTLSAMTADDGDVRAARAHLAAACAKPNDAAAAWDRLYRDAHAMQAGRGVRTAAAIAQVLRSAGLVLRDDPEGSTSEILERLCRWTARLNAHFTILGVDRPLSMDEAFIPLEPFVREDDADARADEDLAAAVARYHDWGRRLPDRACASSDPDALGRFYRLSVVVAGPGTGKSTLLAKVARAYALDGFPVLKVTALAIARRMTALGQGFEEALFDLALDGSGVGAAAARAAALADWVVLIDGLDEAGADQARVVEGLKGFVEGRVQVRVIVATRPVGYARAALADWRHYDLPSVTEYDADRVLSDLLHHILPADDVRRPRLKALVEAAVGRGGAGKAALKTPLMLGLAAALFASGGPLGGSRPAFYRAIFKMIEGSPRAIASPATTTSVRSRFLDLLGWNLTRDPMLSADAVLDLCAQALGAELPASWLAARQLADQCRDYWEALGVIEQLRHAGDHAIAFVHKSFGEYAAGRYLAAATTDLRRAIVAESLQTAAWREPVAFAAALGAAPVILESLSDQGFAEGEGEARLLTALDILIDVAPPQPIVVAQPILQTAFEAALDDRRGVVGALGLKLAMLAPIYPDETLALAGPLLDHPQAWTRLAGLASCFAARPSLYDTEGWIDALDGLSSGGAAGLDEELRGLRVHDAYGDLLQAFAGDVAEQIITTFPPEKAQAVFERAFTARALHTVGFIIRMERLIQGNALKPWWTSGLKEIAPAFSEPEFRARMLKAFTTFMRGLQDAEIAPDPVASNPGRTLYTLGGFLELVGFARTALPAIWPLEVFGADSDVRWVWGAVARLAKLPADLLTREAAELEAAMAAYDGEALSLLFKRTPSVDIAAPVWTDAPSLPPDPERLEQALRRESELVINAALQIAGGGGPDLWRRLASRLLADATGGSLAAAAQLAAELPRDEALDLLFKHACHAPRAGSAHVIGSLQALGAEDDPRRAQVLRAALLSRRPLAALAAAEWAKAKPMAEDLPLLRDAFEHWRKTEAPYPVGGGAVPSSPRAQLLATILALAPKPWRDLVVLYEDPRLDVKDIARDALGANVLAHEGERDEIADAVAGDLPARLVQTVLDHVEVFTQSQIRRMAPALEDPDVERRFAAMFLLKSSRLPMDERRGHLMRLRRDPGNAIRERAAKLLREIT